MVVTPNQCATPDGCASAPIVSQANNDQGGTSDSDSTTSGSTGDTGTGTATNSVKIVEQQGNVYEFSIPGANGDLSVITEMTQNGNQLVLNGMHIQGSGSGTSSLSELRSVARALGQQYGVDEVVINGGERTSGANIGKNPRPITIKVNQ